jgi:hypothetical protein
VLIMKAGAVHQGRGKMQPLIDERGTAAQRAALLSILTGKETDPMMTVFSIYTAMCETIHPPIHTKISIDLDLGGRRGTCEAEGSRLHARRTGVEPGDPEAIERPDRAAERLRIWPRRSRASLVRVLGCGGHEA